MNVEHLLYALTVSMTAEVLDELMDKHDLGSDVSGLLKHFRFWYGDLSVDEMDRVEETLGNERWANFMDLTD